MQQLLPFTVLKQEELVDLSFRYIQLQQLLPFTVLKHRQIDAFHRLDCVRLQQLLPFTVLKLQIRILDAL